MNDAGAQWFFAGGAPGVYATRINGAVAVPWGAGGYPNPNYTVYDLRDDSIQAGSTYEYKAKYRPETPSINTYKVTVNEANCGGAPQPTPTPGIGDGRITGYCTWPAGAENPQVHLTWSRNPPPGQGAADSNSLQKGDCFPNDPGNYWCFLNNGAQFSYTDSAVQRDTQYQYRVKYRPDLTSVNTFNIYTSGVNCGAPPPSPAPLDISPDFQTIPANVTALFTATGGDGSYAWTAPGGGVSGSGSSVGVVFTNNETTSVTRTVAVTSGAQTEEATVEVEGVRTYQDDIAVSGLASRYVFINGNAPFASSSYATLTLAHGFAQEATASMTMKIGNTLAAAQAAEPIPFDTSFPWDICDGFAVCEPGLYTVYVIYRTGSGDAAPVVMDNIVFTTDGIAGLPTVAINDGRATTPDRVVTLTLQSGFVNVPDDEVSMRLSNTIGGLEAAPSAIFSPSVKDWDLCSDAGPVCENGLRTVFAQYCARGVCSMTAYDDIFLDSAWPAWGVRISNDDPSTMTKDVQLNLNPWFGGVGAVMFVSNTADFDIMATAAYADTIAWDLCAGLPTCDPGDRSVFVRYTDASGGTLGWPSLQSPRYQDDIALGVTPTPTPTPVPLSAGVLINDGSATTTSRLVQLRFASPFGSGPGVSMRPANENALTKRDRDIVLQLGGGIDSQPGTQRQLPTGAASDAVGTRQTPVGTPVARDGVAADTAPTGVPELESGAPRPFVQRLTEWDLCSGADTCAYGSYKVYVQYYRAAGTEGAAILLAAAGDEVSGVYYDTIVFTSPTPTPPPPPPVTPPVIVPPPGPPGPGTGGGAGGAVDALTAASNTIGLITMISLAAVVMSAIVTAAPIFATAGSGALAFAGQSFRIAIGLLPRRKKVWGTVYDANTKRPIPFVKVQLLDRNKRVLETRVADREGRYGFLTTPESLMAQNVQIQILPVANGYAFPSHTAPTVDTFIYNNLYFGDLITVSEKTLINYDVPMDPLHPSAAPLVLKSPSIALGASVAAIADAGFWLGVVMVPLNFLLNPNPFTLGVMFLFFGSASLRIWGISEHPFGVVKDAQTGRPVPFALMTLNDLSGKRVGFTVTDEQGRYFLVIDKGTYELSAYTPATVQPQRQSKSIIEARKGWITRELTL